MKKNKLMSKVLLLIITALSLILAPSIKTSALEVRDNNKRDYYISGKFEDSNTDEYLMRKTTNENERRRTIVVHNSNVDYEINIKEKDVDGNLTQIEKVASGTIAEPGTYNITLTKSHTTGGKLKYDVKVESTDASSTKDKYYVLGEFNGYQRNKSSQMTKSDTNDKVYYLDVRTTKKNSEFFIKYNDKTIEDKTLDDFNKDNSKTKFSIADPGNYRIKLDFKNGAEGVSGEITVKDTSEVSDFESYYVVGDFNNNKKDINSLMTKDDSSDNTLYQYTITTKERNTQFSIANGSDYYKTEGLNKGTNFLIKDKGTYKITLQLEPTYKVTIEEKESDKYYILGIDSTEKDSYSEMEYVSKGKYEKEVHVDKETLFYFADEQEGEFHDKNGKDYVLPTYGDYYITFTIKNGEHNVVIENMDEEEQHHKYYLLGNFNKYIISEDYSLELNEDNLDFTEFRIEVELKKNDEFYISDGKKIYKRPDNTNLVVDEDGRYEILFSKDYDYGNDYHISFKLLDEKENEIEIVEINNVDDLLKMIEDCKVDNYSLYKSFELTADLDLEGLVIEPIQILRGELNGNYHKISNFSLDRGTNGNEFGFIRKTTDEASIRNLILEYDVENKEKKTILGGIVGINYGKIYNCTYNGTINGVNIVGGIAGSNEDSGEIVRCTNIGNISAKTILGGITGLNKGLVKDSTNKAVINQLRFTAADENKVSNIGGIVGLNEGTVNRCTNNETIGTKQVGNFIGGITGSNLGEVKNSINNGNVNGNKFVGGIVGYYAEFMDNTTDKYYNTTILLLKEVLKEYDKNVPEIDEDEDIEIEDKEDIKREFKYNINNGNIYGETSVGGVVGYASNDTDSKPSKDRDNFDVMLSLNEGEVYANQSYAGGIVGRHSSGTISECYNTGEISANKNYVGGIVGESNGTVSYCYNISRIEGESYIGGIGGKINKMHDCYSITDITTDEGSFIGALAGLIDKIDKDIYNNFFVYSDFNGIDNTNYKNKAEKVDRTKLATKESLGIDLDNRYYSVDDKHKSYPYLRMMIDDKHDNLITNEFKKKLAKTNSFNCILTFLDEDDNTVGKIYVPYGESVNKNRFPIPPEKDDNFASWEEFEMNNITSDMAIHICYEEIITSIASDNSATPRLIVEGKFYDTTMINLEETNNDYLIKDTKYHNLGSYKVDVIEYDHDLDVSDVVVKFRLPKTEDVELAFIDNGNIKFIDYTLEGDYAKFKIDKSQEFILLEKEYYNFSNPKFVANLGIGIIVSAAVVAAVITTTVIVTRKVKNKPRLTKEEKQARKAEKKRLKEEAKDNK